MKYLLFLAISILSTTVAAKDFVLTSQKQLATAPVISLILNDIYLITYAITKSSASGEQSRDVINFQNKAWETNKIVYNKIRKLGEKRPDIIASNENLKTFERYFNSLIATDEYIIIKNQTLKYMQDCLTEWDLNLERSTSIINLYSGFELHKSFNIYITHPALGNGSFYPDSQNTISFGAWATFKNYFTVYIWHEIIHFYMELDEKSHAANQLLTDNELRVQLNNEALEPLQGHDSLIPLMRKNKDLWERYKAKPTNLNDFAERMLN